MKKVLSFVLAVMVFAAALPFAVSAEGNDPIMTQFTSVNVQDGVASFVNAEGETVAAFPGEYPYDCLVKDEATGWDPEALFNGPELCYNGTLKLTGSGDTGNFVWTCDGKTITFTLTRNGDTATRRANACDLDKFLWEKGWYLSNLRRSYDVGVLQTTDYYRFVVMDVLTNQPVKNEEGKCLYVMIKHTTWNLENLNYRATPTDFFSNVFATQFYMDLGEHATITCTYADEGVVPATTAFTVPFTDKDGSEFTGLWYYYQWMIAKCRGLGSSDGKYSVSHPTDVGADTYAPYNKYTPKKGVKAEIAYVLEGEDEVLVYNSDDQLLFPYKGETEDVMNMLQGEDGCGFNQSRTYTDADSGKTYKKWTNVENPTPEYPEGTSPLGDINLDDAVSADDITVLARDVAGIEKNPAIGYVLSEGGAVYALGDVNFDNEVNADDLTALARAVAGIEALSAVGTTYKGVYEG